MSYLKVVDSRGEKIPFSALQLPYEGAATGRRMSSWGTSTMGPNASLYGSLNRLRSRTRELIRNNPLVDGSVDTFVSNLVGTGISPRWQVDNPELKTQIQDLWNDWTEEADLNGLCDFYGLQSLVSRALIDAGECLVKFIPRSANEDLSVPLQLQVLEADHLDESYNTIAPNGNEIRMGIEIDAEGKRQAYWLFKEHPGEYFILSGINRIDRVRVPASECLHIFRPMRPGQMRGRPWLSSIIVKLRELDQYEDAELVRKKTAAMFGGFIEEAAGADDSRYLGRDAGTDANQAQIIALEPGTFPLLPPGKKVSFSSPVDVGVTYAVWIKQQLREIAQGIGITYEQLTGDLSDVNYSSIRAGLLEFRRRCVNLQFQTLVFQFCKPVSKRWMDAAVLSGALNIAGYFPNRRIYRRIKWRPDGWPWVDPVKEILAEQLAIRNGLKSRAQSIAERGGDVESVDKEIAEDNARADDLGLIFDSDPRKTSSSGSIQKATDAAIAESMTATSSPATQQQQGA